MAVRYTLKEVTKATGAKTAFVQNCIARKTIQLQDDAIIEPQIKRRYTIRDAVVIGAMVEITKLKIPPGIATGCTEAIRSRLSKLLIGEHFKKLAEENEDEIQMDRKDSLVFILYPTDNEGGWDKIEAHMHDGQFYYESTPDYEKAHEIIKKYKEGPFKEEYETEEWKEWKQALIHNGKYDKAKYQSMVKSSALNNDEEFAIASESFQESVNISEFPDCFCILQVDRLIRRILDSLGGVPWNNIPD